MDDVKSLKNRRSYLVKRIGEGIVKKWTPAKMLAMVTDLHNVEEAIKAKGSTVKALSDEIFSVEYWTNQVRLTGKIGAVRQSLSDIHPATAIAQNKRYYYTVKMVYSAKDHHDADRAQQVIHRYLIDEWDATQLSIASNEEGNTTANIYKYRVAGTEDDMLLIEAAYNYFRLALRTYEPKVKSEGIWFIKNE